ncbi:hypothetical protein PF004_g9191 [Phytophthora fragariae]|uniref:DUF4461 domain-containing protein n=1 Tax=Phytophthora fragariae TaxID=53985 RepID=A0A6G0P4N8_9STRA|nr:hypothetical protein PF003_g15938 [Phytophthora fragariae]KAE9235115.1 hypothetical protein PF004_g9191 [Phytophthora fragariae]
MAKRSTTLKQFLLRVHPDHFHNNPKVHDENLQRLGAPREKVYFSVMVPSLSSTDQNEESKRLKRFALDLAANIETKMVAVLKECGIVVQGSVEEEEEEATSGASSRRVKKRAERRPDNWRQGQQGAWRHPSGMDFGGFTKGEMYAKADAAVSASKRRKKPIQTLKGLLEFMKEDETMETQQRRRIAWESIQSVRNTLKRELGLEDVLFSCGWSTMHLNTTAMILLQTLRKYTRANKQGIFTPKDFLRGATIDLSANPSGIDFSNAYRIGLNPADVPVQWVQVLETIDADMVVFMKATRESLATLQADATSALGEANISRGHTCSALGYRTFLQSMRRRDAGDPNNEQGILEKLALVIEDDSYEWVVLETGETPCIFKAVTRDEGIPVGEAIVACEELLKAVVGMTPPSSRGSIPQEMVRFLDTYTQGRSMCISRSYGLGQDGVFTLPVDWFKW